MIGQQAVVCKCVCALIRQIDIDPASIGAITDTIAGSVLSLAGTAPCILGLGIEYSIERDP